MSAFSPKPLRLKSVTSWTPWFPIKAMCCWRLLPPPDSDRLLCKIYKELKNLDNNKPNYPIKSVMRSKQKILNRGISNCQETLLQGEGPLFALFVLVAPLAYPENSHTETVFITTLFGLLALDSYWLILTC